MVDKKDIVTINNLEEEVAALGKGLTSEKELLRAADLILQVRKTKNFFDNKRKARTAPTQETIDLINSDFKPILDPLKRMEKDLNKSIETYATKQLTLDLEKQAELRKESRNRELVIPVGYTTIPSDNGDIRFRRTYNITIDDEKKVPSKFKTVDTSLIEAAIDLAEGNIKIPGVTITPAASIALYVSED